MPTTIKPTLHSRYKGIGINDFLDDHCDLTDRVEQWLNNHPQIKIEPKRFRQLIQQYVTNILREEGNVYSLSGKAPHLYPIDFPGCDIRVEKLIKEAVIKYSDQYRS